MKEKPSNVKARRVRSLKLEPLFAEAERPERRPAKLDLFSYILIYLLVLFSSVLVWMLQYDVPALDMALLGAAAAGAIFTVARLLPLLPRVAIILGGMGAAEIAAYLLRSELVRGFEYTAQLIYVRFTEVTPGYQTATLPDISFEESGMPLFLFFAVFLVGSVLGAGILLLRSFWVTLACTAPILWLAMSSSDLPPLLPTLCLIGGWVAMLFKIKSRTADAAKLRLAAMGLSMVLVAAVFALFPGSEYVASKKTLEVRNNIENIDFDRGLLNLIEAGFGPGKKVAARNTTSVRLTGEGRLEFAEGNAMRIKAGAGTMQAYRQYIRGFSCDEYSGQSWRQSGRGYDPEDTGYQPLLYSIFENSLEVYKSEYIEYWGEIGYGYPVGTVEIELYDSLPYRPIVYGTSRMSTDDPDLFHFEKDVFLVGRGKESLKYKMMQYDLAGTFSELMNGPEGLMFVLYAETASIPETERDQWTHAGAMLDVFGDMDYSYKVFGDENLLTEEETEYLDFITGQYTRLPEGLGERLLALATKNNISVPKDKSDWSQAAYEVMQYVMNAAEYSRNPGAQPRNEDFVEYFLTQSQKGYCVHFASAGTAMLRALGVPARYVEGFILPPSDAIEYSVDENGNEYFTITEPDYTAKWVEVPNANAHAWVEVWYPYVGWVPLDVTPGGPDYIQPQKPEDSEGQARDRSASNSRDSSQAEEKDSSDSGQEADSSSSAVQDVSGGAVGGGDADGALSGNAHTLLIVALSAVVIVTAVAAVLLGYRCVRRRRTHLFCQQDTNAAALVIYRYLERLRRFGYQPSEQAFDLAGKARFSQHKLDAGERSQLQQEAATARMMLMEQITVPQKLLFYILGL